MPTRYVLPVLRYQTARSADAQKLICSPLENAGDPERRTLHLAPRHPVGIRRRSPLRRRLPLLQESVSCSLRYEAGKAGVLKSRSTLLRSRIPPHHLPTVHRRSARRPSQVAKSSRNRQYVCFPLSALSGNRDEQREGTRADSKHAVPVRKSFGRLL